MSITRAGLGDYVASAPHGIIALFNAFNAENCVKSMNLIQFYANGVNYLGDNTRLISSKHSKCANKVEYSKKLQQ